MQDNIKNIIDQVEKLTVLELADLVKALEEKFGVSAQPAAAPPVVTEGSSTPVDEQTNFNVVLAETGANKIGVIKAVREIVPSLGLADAKTLAESAPKIVLENANKATATEAKTKLEAAGAKVELK
ncbi:MAG: 50S ribosomal protein L7/L12 [Patescibacteria group bacterium]